MDYIEKLLASRRKKKRILAMRRKGVKPGQVAKNIGVSRQYVDFVWNQNKGKL